MTNEKNEEIITPRPNQIPLIEPIAIKSFTSPMPNPFNENKINANKPQTKSPFIENKAPFNPLEYILKPRPIPIKGKVI